MLGAEKNNANESARGLIRSVVAIETVCTYSSSDQLIPISIVANDYTNKEIVLRTLGSFGTYTFRLAQQLTITALDVLANGESILLKLEQKDGLGNAVLILKDSSNNTLETKQLAPSGTYLITRNSETIGTLTGYNIICVNAGSAKGFSVSSGLTGRQVGFGVYDVVGDGGITRQIYIPASNANDTQEVQILVTGGTCQVESTNSSLIYSSVLGNNVLQDLPIGLNTLKYYNSKIYLK